jgi:hypothetical protein
MTAPAQCSPAHPWGDGFVVPLRDLATIARRIPPTRSKPIMPDAADDDSALEAEFDILARRAGLAVVADRKPSLLRGFKDLKRMTALMRQPRTAADEPAGTYSILTVTRSV